MACLPPADWKITEANSRGRRDIRHLCVMSIDPPGCKDIDDALHVRRLPNGNLEVGVHIADVTYFVHHGTAIDIEAADRSNTTYLVERRLDMLPVRVWARCSLVVRRVLTCCVFSGLAHGDAMLAEGQRGPVRVLDDVGNDARREDREGGLLPQHHPLQACDDVRPGAGSA